MLTRIFKFLLLSFIFSFIFTSQVSAQIIINEILPNPSTGSDWVEIYNNSNTSVELNGWVIDDEGTSTNMFEINEATISAQGFLLFEVGTRLNKSGDTVFLKDNSNNEIDHYQYKSDPGEGISFGRVTVGGSWGICQLPTPSAVNICTLIPTPTPIPAEESKTTPTQIPTPTYKPISMPSPTSKPTLKTTSTLIEEPTPSSSESLLGVAIEPTPSGDELISDHVSNDSDKKISSDLIAKILIFSGLIFLAVPGFFLLRPIIKGYNTRNG